MNSITVAALVFGCTFAGALAGLRVHGSLPEHHLAGDSRDVIKLVMGLIATVTALVLGLLISAAHRSYESQEAEVQQIGVHLYQLDRALERFGPETRSARDVLRQIVAAELLRASSNGGIAAALTEPSHAQKAVGELFELIAGLTPQSAAQRFMQSQALQLLTGLGDTRLLLNEQSRGVISWPFLVILVFWLTVLFIGFGLFAPFNATVSLALLMGAISVAGALFLILEMNQPYTGVMQISIAPLRNALTQMGP